MAKDKNPAAVEHDGQEEPEYERRWLVRAIDPDIRRYPSHLIEQGYFDKTRDLRIRIVDGQEAVLARKTGKGRDRKEKPKKAPLDVGTFLLDSTPYAVRKRRYLRDGWEVDFFEGPLSGLVLAEIEKKSLEALAKVKLPKWITEAVEVTDTLSNRLLAHIAYDLSIDGRSERPVLDLLPRRVPAIVLTGGPCSGKSTMMRLFREEFAGMVHAVPETATIVIEQVGLKPPVGDPVGMRTFQRVIYRVQLSFEKGAHSQAQKDGRKLLLDRGTVDGAAYMPDGVSDLSRTCQTTIDEEYGRYDGVICLETPPEAVYEAEKANNPARYETYEQAVATGKRLADVWRGHPNFTFIRNGKSWDEKLKSARAALKSLLAKR